MITEIKEKEVYSNEDSNVFIRTICNGNVSFIEGYSPSAMHKLQVIPVENLISYMNKWEFEYNEYLTEFLHN